MLHSNLLLDNHCILALTPVIILLSVPMSLLAILAAVAMRLAPFAHLTDGSVESTLAPRTFPANIAKYIVCILYEHSFVVFHSILFDL